MFSVYYLRPYGSYVSETHIIQYCVHPLILWYCIAHGLVGTVCIWWETYIVFIQMYLYLIQGIHITQADFIAFFYTTVFTRNYMLYSKLHKPLKPLNLHCVQRALVTLPKALYRLWYCDNNLQSRLHGYCTIFTRHTHSLSDHIKTYLHFSRHTLHWNCVWCHSRLAHSTNYMSSELCKMPIDLWNGGQTYINGQPFNC